MDYLRRRGLRNSVQYLYAEVPASEIIPLDRLDRFIEDVGALRGGQSYQAAGMLAEWWQVFWNILSGNGGSSSSAAPTATTSAATATTTNVNMGTMSSSSSSGSQAPNTMHPNGSNVPIAPASAGQLSAKSATPRPLKVPINKDISAVTRKNFTRPPALAPKKKLDVESLVAIERSLSAVGLMNRDLTRLNADEKANLSNALRNNRVSIDAWTSYLQLCQEITRNSSNHSGSVLRSAIGGYSSANLPVPSQSGGASGNVGTSASLPPSNATTANVANVATTVPLAQNVIIDQESRPVDSRQILWLRQSLYHQYMMKNAAAFAGGTSSSTTTTSSAPSSSNMSLRSASLSNSVEVSPLLINAPQLPLESPFYSPPRKLDDFAPLRNSGMDVPLTTEYSSSEGGNNVNSSGSISNNQENGIDEDCMNAELHLDLFDVGFGDGDLMSAFTADVSSVPPSTGEQSIFELPHFEFYNGGNDGVSATDIINGNTGSGNSSSNSISSSSNSSNICSSSSSSSNSNNNSSDTNNSSNGNDVILNGNSLMADSFNTTNSTSSSSITAGNNNPTSFNSSTNTTSSSFNSIIIPDTLNLGSTDELLTSEEYISSLTSTILTNHQQQQQHQQQQEEDLHSLMSEFLDVNNL